MANTIKMGPCTPWQQAPSVNGNPIHMPEGTIDQATSLGPLPGGPLGTYTQSPIPPFPGSEEINPCEVPSAYGAAKGPGYSFQMDASKAANSGIGIGHYQGYKDTSYPTSVPGPDLVGEASTTNMGPQGDQLNWSTIGAYRYPEFPMSPAKQKIAEGIQGTIPLT